MNIPKEQLRNGRMKALRMVKKEKSRKLAFVGVGAVIVFCLCFVLSVQQSPTFASFAAKIPGLSVLVEMFQENKGIQDALENDYYEEIGLMESKNGKTVTLQGAIIDEYNIFLNYNFDFTREVKNHNDYELEIFQSGKSIMGGSYSIGTMDDVDGPVSHSKHKFEMQLPKPINRKELDFSVIITFGDGTKFEFPFTLKNSIAKTKITKANKEVTVSGQKFTITEVRRTPLRVAIDIEVSPHNTMKILSYEGMVIDLSTGNQRKPIMNGITAFNIDENIATTYLFQSNYFYEADELTIRFNKIMAVPKDNNFIEVDFTTNEVLYVPEYIDWDISVKNNEVTIKSQSSKGMGRQYIVYAISEDGNRLESGNFELHMDGNFKTTFYGYKGKAKLMINYYDNSIGENIQVPISLK